MYDESVACYEAAKHTQWLKAFVGEMGIVNSIVTPMIVYCDNEAATQDVKNDKITKRNKYHDVKYCLVSMFKKGSMMCVTFAQIL